MADFLGGFFPNLSNPKLTPATDALNEFITHVQDGNTVDSFENPERVKNLVDEALGKIAERKTEGKPHKEGHLKAFQNAIHIAGKHLLSLKNTKNTKLIALKKLVHSNLPRNLESAIEKLNALTTAVKSKGPFRYNSGKELLNALKLAQEESQMIESANPGAVNPRLDSFKEAKKEVIDAIKLRLDKLQKTGEKDYIENMEELIGSLLEDENVSIDLSALTGAILLINQNLKISCLKNMDMSKTTKRPDGDYKRLIEASRKDSKDVPFSIKSPRSSPTPSLLSEASTELDSINSTYSEENFKDDFISAVKEQTEGTKFYGQNDEEANVLFEHFKTLCSGNLITLGYSAGVMPSSLPTVQYETSINLEDPSNPKMTLQGKTEIQGYHPICGVQKEDIVVISYHFKSSIPLSKDAPRKAEVTEFYELS
jgi:hypothetical protein